MDDVMKKVENLLFSEDEEPVEEPEPKEVVKEAPVKVQKTEPVKRQEKRTESYIEIEGSIESLKIADARIRVASGCEIETGGLRFVFEEGSVKVYGA